MLKVLYNPSTPKQIAEEVLLISLFAIISFTLHFKMKYLGNLWLAESSFVILVIFEAEYVLNLHLH